MCANLLTSISNILDFGNNDLSSYNTTYEIGINSEGERLEYYIKDSLTGAFLIRGKEAKEQRYSEEFAWMGNQNNPPDIIIKSGDSFEIKKSKSPSPTIALNSSPPKDVLHSDDPRIISDCKNCDGGNWNEKDLYYVMGHVKNNIVNHLFYVQGKCYAAKREVYNRIAVAISSAVRATDLELRETNELGRVNRVDPLGITDLRIRGMWQIQHPRRVFNYIYRPIPSNFGLAALLLEGKYNSYPIKDRLTLENNNKVTVNRVLIKDPNNPANRLRSILIYYPSHPTL